MIREFEIGTASIHDGQHFDKVFDSLNTSRDVSADRGYAPQDQGDWLESKGYRHQIQRKGRRNKPLSECRQRRNPRIAKTRARIEHVFAAINQVGGKLINTIGQARPNVAITIMATCYNLERLVYFKRTGTTAF